MISSTRTWLFAWSIVSASSAIGLWPSGESTDRDKSGTARGIRKQTAHKLPRLSDLRAVFLSKRRARDSNPQPLTGHLYSKQAASHSHTLPLRLAFYWLRKKWGRLGHCRRVLG